MIYKRFTQFEGIFPILRPRQFMFGVVIFLIVGCTVELDDKTVSPVPQSLDNNYVIIVETVPGPYVLSLDTPQVLINGTWRIMQGTGSNEWEYVHGASPITSEIQYRYKVGYIFNASLIPGVTLFTNQGSTVMPSLDSFYSLVIDPAIKMSGDELLQVPLRWCAVQGSSAVEDPTAVGATSTDDVLLRRHERASDNIWIPGANIIFRSAMFATDSNQASFPIIPDPNPPSQGGAGLEGDIEIVNTSYAPEVGDVIADCEAAWDQLEQDGDSNIEGVIVVNISNFVAPSGGMSTYQGLQVFGSNLLCSEFSTLAQSVCSNPLNYPSNAATAIVIRDNVTRLQFEPFENTLAHELGHALFLGHGNGLDDDGDGKIDKCCDNDEDPDALPNSLMCPSCSSILFTSHQKDFSRQVALQTPGTVIDPPTILKPVNVLSDQRVDTRQDTDRPGLDLIWTGMSENLEAGNSLFTHKLYGLIPENANYRYLLFVDLDDNETTGLSPNSIGYKTTLKGINLIIDVRVKGPVKSPEIETALYVSNNEKWQNESNNAYSFVDTAVEAETGVQLFNLVNTIVSTKIIGEAGNRVAIRAESHSSDRGLADVLPDNSDLTRLLIRPPEYPVCSASPQQLKPGELVNLKAYNLLPGETAHVLMGEKQVAVGEIDDKGNTTIKFSIPENARSGVRLITVVSGKTAITANCAVEVVGDKK